MGRCQFIPEQLWGPVEGQCVWGALCEEPPPSGPRGLVQTHSGVEAQQASCHSPRPAQQHGVTCAIPGRTLAPAALLSVPGAVSLAQGTLLPRRGFLPAASHLSFPLLALGPAAIH